MELSISRLSMPPGRRVPANEVQPDPDGPTFLNALREQLCLRLTSAKGQAQMLVIDHVEKPSEN